MTITSNGDLRQSSTNMYKYLKQDLRENTIAQNF